MSWSSCRNGSSVLFRNESTFKSDGSQFEEYIFLQKSLKVIFISAKLVTTVPAATVMAVTDNCFVLFFICFFDYLKPCFLWMFNYSSGVFVSKSVYPYYVISFNFLRFLGVHVEVTREASNSKTIFLTLIVDELIQTCKAYSRHIIFFLWILENY